jgi:hypothetical protein
MTQPAGDRQPSFFTNCDRPQPTIFGKTRFLHLEMCENLSKKSAKMRPYLEQTESLTAKMEMQIDKMDLGRRD